MYGGDDVGYTHGQAEAFTRVDSLASRALEEGVQVLRPMYESLPAPIRDRALAMLETFDAASVVATSRFLASGAQPFASAAQLQALTVPALLVRGDDDLHPASISDLYAANLPLAAVAGSSADAAAEIRAFCDALPAFDR